MTVIVEDEGHVVSVMAGDLDEARRVVALSETGDFDVAIVDGNLSPNDSSGRDGAELTRLLRAKHTGITIIGLSGSNVIEGVDYSVSKTDDPEQKIPAIIADI